METKKFAVWQPGFFTSFPNGKVQYSPKISIEFASDFLEAYQIVTGDTESISSEMVSNQEYVCHFYDTGVFDLTNPLAVERFKSELASFYLDQ